MSNTTFQIICKRGLIKQECPFVLQKGMLCVECPYVAYVPKVTKEKTEQEEKQEDVQQ